jgi:hypothetical protein
MSKQDRIWSEEDERAAVEEGWFMALTIDSGRPGSYYGIYPCHPKFRDPHTTARHVIAEAQRGSKLHVRALQVIANTRRAK